MEWDGNKIPSTVENWESGVLGQSEEHAVISDLTTEEVLVSIFDR